MTCHREPRSIAAATTMLERFAEVSAQAAAIEAERNENISQINAVSDAALLPLRKEAETVAAKVENWFGKNRDALLEGKRKSIELGGCMIGTRNGRAKLAVVGDEAGIVEALSVLRWASPFLRRKVTLDRTATLRGVDGRHGPKLAELGLTRKDGEETFFVEPTGQNGTIG